MPHRRTRTHRPHLYSTRTHRSHSAHTSPRGNEGESETRPRATRAQTRLSGACARSPARELCMHAHILHHALAVDAAMKPSSARTEIPVRKCTASPTGVGAARGSPTQLSARHTTASGRADAEYASRPPRPHTTAWWHSGQRLDEPPSHSSMHAVWNKWPHGRLRTFSSATYASRHMAHCGRAGLPAAPVAGPSAAPVAALAPSCSACSPACSLSYRSAEKHQHGASYSICG